MNKQGLWEAGFVVPSRWGAQRFSREDVINLNNSVGWQGTGAPTQGSVPGPVTRILWLGDLICGSRMRRGAYDWAIQGSPEFSLHVKVHIILASSLDLILLVSLPSHLTWAHLPNNLLTFHSLSHGLLLGEPELRQPYADIRHVLLPEHLYTDQ